MGQRSNRVRARVFTLTAGLLLASLLPVVTASPASADATAGTNDTSVPIQTGWWFYVNQTTSQINALITQHGARLTQIRVNNQATGTFDVTMVANSGAYAVPGWWWYVGVDATGLGNLLSTNKARLISLDPYVTTSGLRFAAVMVDNTSPATGRGWCWFYGLQASQVVSSANSCSSRPISLRPYRSGGTTYFAMVTVGLNGIDYKGWNVYFGQQPADINNHINNDHLRPVSIAADPGGGFDTIYNTWEGEPFTWWFGLDPNTLLTDVQNTSGRILDVSSYSNGSSTVYAAVAFDNSNVLAGPLNAESTRVKNYMDGNGWGGGINGVYFAKVGSATPIVAVGQDFRHEPASSMKVLYLLYALKQVQAGTDSLGSSFTWYPNPADPTNPGVCPDPSWEVPSNAQTTTLQNALNQMMQISDNRMTRGMAIRYGLGPVNAMAASLGMSNTHLRQAFIGCGFNGGVRNDLTVTDAGKLYSAVQKALALSSQYRKIFFNTEPGGAPSSSSYIGLVVSQEAAALGKSADVTAFLAATDVRWKAGSYEFCLSATCNPYRDDYSIDGRMTIPYKKSNGTTSPHQFVFGDFVNDLVIPCAAGSNCAQEMAAGNMIFDAYPEAARSTIRAALMTWP